MQNRRAYDRFNLEGALSVRSRGRTEFVPGAYLDNLSFGGLAMYSPAKIDAGQKIEFILSTPLIDAPIPGKGEIKYVNLSQRGPKGLFFMGVQFTQINQDLVMHLIKRIHLRLSQQNRDRAASFNTNFIPY